MPYNLVTPVPPPVVAAPDTAKLQVYQIITDADKSTITVKYRRLDANGNALGEQDVTVPAAVYASEVPPAGLTRYADNKAVSYRILEDAGVASGGTVV